MPQSPDLETVGSPPDLSSTSREHSAGRTPMEPFGLHPTIETDRDYPMGSFPRIWALAGSI
jgi:hypothetical protein